MKLTRKQWFVYCLVNKVKHTFEFDIPKQEALGCVYTIFYDMQGQNVQVWPRKGGTVKPDLRTQSPSTTISPQEAKHTSLFNLLLARNNLLHDKTREHGFPPIKFKSDTRETRELQGLAHHKISQKCRHLCTATSLSIVPLYSV